VRRVGAAVREEMERDAARGGTRKGWVMAIPNCQFVPNYQLQSSQRGFCGSVKP